MRVLILGGDGYIGWPTAMHFAAKGDQVCAVDNYLRRTIAKETNSAPLFQTPDLLARSSIFESVSGKLINVKIGDCTDYSFISSVIRDFHPDTIIHYAEQPSAPYSMVNLQSARLTFENNLNATFNLIWAVIESEMDCHVIKLGTMGEYGTPNIDIEEGWLNIKHNGRSDRFLFPRQAGSLYHTTKILDTDLLWFYVRMHELRVTDLMQGPVYGIQTKQTEKDERLYPFFNYDDIFGTVVNRFITQAVAEIPLTVYGKGGQTRGYLNIKDTLRCVELAAKNPPEKGSLNIFNQFTEQFSVNQIAEKVRLAGINLGLDVQINSIKNPRNESEEHYYNAKHSGMLDLGLQPHYLTEEVVTEMLSIVLRYKDNIDHDKIMPRVKWKK